MICKAEFDFFFKQKARKNRGECKLRLSEKLNLADLDISAKRAPLHTPSSLALTPKFYLILMKKLRPKNPETSGIMVYSHLFSKLFKVNLSQKSFNLDPAS